jgi:hypothetical protein
MTGINWIEHISPRYLPVAFLAKRRTKFPVLPSQRDAGKSRAAL